MSKQDFSSPFNNDSVKTLCVPSVTEPLGLEPPEPYALLVETDMFATGYLRPFTQEERAKTGDAEKRALTVEWTLIAKNEASSATIADLTTS